MPWPWEGTSSVTAQSAQLTNLHQDPSSGGGTQAQQFSCSVLDQKSKPSCISSVIPLRVVKTGGVWGPNQILWVIGKIVLHEYYNNSGTYMSQGWSPWLLEEISIRSLARQILYYALPTLYWDTILKESSMSHMQSCWCQRPWDMLLFEGPPHVTHLTLDSIPPWSL